MIWPAEGMPPIMRFLSNFTPLTHVVEAMRCIVSRGKEKYKNNKNKIIHLYFSMDISLF